MNTATQLPANNNVWLTVGKALWVGFWFLAALAVKASIIILAIVGKLFVLLLAGIFSGDRDDDSRENDWGSTNDMIERQRRGLDDFDSY